MIFCAATLIASGVAQAQQTSGAAGYPAKPIKIVMPFPAGGPTDILRRLLGQKLTEAWGQNVVIDNRPGGGGMIGGALAARSPADGYTLFLGGITTLVIATFEMTDEDLAHKFRSNCEPMVGKARCDELLDTVWRLEKASDLRTFFAW